MSFSSFSFDDVDIAELTQTHNAPEMSEDDKAVMELLKRLLQSHANDKLHRLAELQQQLERDFLFWVALFQPEPSAKQPHQSCVQESFQQINEIIASCKQQLRHSIFGQCKVFMTDVAIGSQEIHPLFEKSLPENLGILVQLCEALPFVAGHAAQLSIAAVNRFDERIVLHLDDLPNMSALLQGIGEVKIDLPNLITLELGLPAWTFPQIVLHKKQGALAPSKQASKSPLLKQLEQASTARTLTPLNQINTLFSQTRNNAQQKTNHTRQQLSLLTKAVLNDDQFNAKQQNQIVTLQSTVRQQASQLQKQNDELTLFCKQIEAELQRLLV